MQTWWKLLILIESETRDQTLAVPLGSHSSQKVNVCASAFLISARFIREYGWVQGGLASRWMDMFR